MEREANREKNSGLEAEWETELSQPSVCAARREISDRSSKTSWEQILLSSESPREGIWKITALLLSFLQGNTGSRKGRRSLGCATSWQGTRATLGSGSLLPGSLGAP